MIRKCVQNAGANFTIMDHLTPVLWHPALKIIWTGNKSVTAIEGCKKGSLRVGPETSILIDQGSIEAYTASDKLENVKSLTLIGGSR